MKTTKNLKICGIRNRQEMMAVAQAGANYGGIWVAIPGSDLSLPMSQAQEMIAQTPADFHLVAVTVSNHLDNLSILLHELNPDYLQLHGYNLPSQILQLKNLITANGYRTQLIKTLHIDCDTGQFLERTLQKAYLESGLDFFLLDSVSSQQKKIGSTGRAIDKQILRTILGTLAGQHIFIAGGIDATNAREIIQEYQPFGIDIFSAVRTEGRVDVQKVCQIATQIEASYG